MDPTWPVTEGRFKTGNRESPIAVCTMASLDLIESLSNNGYAIVGKCVTENLGIEKIIKNIVANPKIRYLLLCGKVSQGHFVGQAIKSLIENGVDSAKRIIGAEGAMPLLRNLEPETIESFRKQVEIIDLRGETDVSKITETAKRYSDKPPDKPSESQAPDIKEKEIERIEAGSSDAFSFNQDEKGYFVILLNREKGEIVAEHYDNNGNLLRIFSGKKAMDIYKKIIELGFVSEISHAAYLGKELTKAEIALRKNLEYEQDKDLE